MNKKYLGFIIILICSFLLLPQYTYSSSKEDYELQEKCGKQCSEWFIKNYGNEGESINTEFGYSVYLFNNHYNKKMNKCFLIWEKDNYKKNYEEISVVKKLSDKNENRQIGLFVSNNSETVTCSVSDKECKSRKEWDALVKPYMEE